MWAQHGICSMFKIVHANNVILSCKTSSSPSVSFVVYTSLCLVLLGSTWFIARPAILPVLVPRVVAPVFAFVLALGSRWFIAPLSTASFLQRTFRLLIYSHHCTTRTVPWALRTGRLWRTAWRPVGACRLWNAHPMGLDPMSLVSFGLDVKYRSHSKSFWRLGFSKQILRPTWSLFSIFFKIFFVNFFLTFFLRPSWQPSNC